MKRIIRTMLVTVISLFIGTYVIATTGTVKTNSLNVREKATTESNSIAVLDKDQSVNIISEENDWYKIQLKSGEGYVKGEYIEVNDETENDKTTEEQSATENNETTTSKTTSSTVSEGNATLIESNVDLYVLPLINTTKIGILEEGTAIIIISNNGRWLYVQSEDKKGWIISQKIDTIDPSAGEIKEEENGVENDIDEDNTDVGSTITDSTTNEATENKTEEATTTDSDNGKYPTTMYVSGDSVNIRKSASTSAEVISGATKNSAIKVIAKEGDWYKVDTEDGIGYIKSDLLTSNKSN